MVGTEDCASDWNGPDSGSFLLLLPLSDSSSPPPSWDPQQNTTSDDDQLQRGPFECPCSHFLLLTFNVLVVVIDLV